MHINLGAENVVNSPSCDMPSGVSVVKGWGFEPLPTDFEACEMHFPKRDDGNLEPPTKLLCSVNCKYERFEGSRFNCHEFVGGGGNSCVNRTVATILLCSRRFESQGRTARATRGFAGWHMGRRAGVSD